MYSKEYRKLYPITTSGITIAAAQEGHKLERELGPLQPGGFTIEWLCAEARKEGERSRIRKLRKRVRMGETHSFHPTDWYTSQQTRKALRK